MVLVPAASPVATPSELTVATTVLVLVHDSVFTLVEVSEVVLPSHTVSGPVITGDELTVTMADAVQPLARVYTTDVVPPPIPPTTPLLTPTVPTAEVVLLQVPPAGVLASVVVAPVHVARVPVIAVGAASTVVTRVAVQPL